jgi:hypothetical protein
MGQHGHSILKQPAHPTHCATFSPRGEKGKLSDSKKPALTSRAIQSFGYGFPIVRFEVPADGQGFPGPCVWTRRPQHRLSLLRRS